MLNKFTIPEDLSIPAFLKRDPNERPARIVVEPKKEVKVEVTHKLVEVDGKGIKGLGLNYVVDLGTGDCFVKKHSKAGREYLSTLTSARKIKKLIKLAKEKH